MSEPSRSALAVPEHMRVYGLPSTATPEQRRRARRITKDTSVLELRKRLLIIRDMLLTHASLPPEEWDALFEQRMEEEVGL